MEEEKTLHIHKSHLKTSTRVAHMLIPVVAFGLIIFTFLIARNAVTSNSSSSIDSAVLGQTNR